MRSFRTGKSATTTLRRSWFQIAPKRWVAISRLEQVELGIPARSIKGRPLDFAIDYCLVDRRCLARYRRRWRALPDLFGFGDEFGECISQTGNCSNATDDLEKEYGPILDRVLELYHSVRK